MVAYYGTNRSYIHSQFMHPRKEGRCEISVGDAMSWMADTLEGSYATPAGEIM